MQPDSSFCGTTDPKQGFIAASDKGRPKEKGDASFSTPDSLSQARGWPGHASHHHQPVPSSWDNLHQRFNPMLPVCEVGKCFYRSGFRTESR